MKRSAYFILLIGLLLLGCDKESAWNCTKKSGTTILEERTPGAFVSVKATGKMDITYRYAASEYVEIEFGKNVVGDITTHVQNGRLYIENQTSCNWVRNMSKTPKVIIYAPHLTYLENRIAGDILFADTLKSNVFHYEQWDANGVVNMTVVTENLKVFAHTGYVEIEVKGKTEIAELYSASVTTFDAANLIAESALVNNSSTYDITCFTNQYLYGAINSSGSIYYHGAPLEIDTDIDGSGVVQPF